MAEKKDSVGKMTKAAILKEFGPQILARFGKDELSFIKGQSTGPGGIDTLRSYVRDYFFSSGGLATKNYVNPVKVVDNRKRKNDT